MKKSPIRNFIFVHAIQRILTTRSKPTNDTTSTNHACINITITTKDTSE